jgi:acyl-CoA dehydrogenase
VAAIAQSRIDIEMVRGLVLATADRLDAHAGVGRYAVRKAQTEDEARAILAAVRTGVAMIKVAAPRMVCDVVDRTIQIYGGAGVWDDAVLPRLYIAGRSLRIADGPDDVHLATVAKETMRSAARSRL